jgi:hypothetical protein
MTAPSPAEEVARICQELIRFDTSNFGDNQGPGERAAAEYTAGLLDEVGLSPEVFESSPGRASVVARLEGEDPSAGALVVHGHLDVVPALRQDWSVDPFAAEEKDGLIWGRGAVDMKDMDAMILGLARQFARDGVTFNTVHPGQIATDRMIDTAGSVEAAEERARDSIPAGRLGTVEELAAAAVFLCSEPAAYITGTMLLVDGGATRSV